MMIPPNELAGALRAYLRESGDATRPPAARPNPGTEGVSVSQNAAQVSRWLDQLRAMSDVRPERVAEIQQRLQTGAYPPPGAAVAEKMLGAQPKGR